MRLLITAPVLSVALWWALFEYGFDAIAFVFIVASLIYIARTIYADWKPYIKTDEWCDGDTTGYGRTE